MRPSRPPASATVARRCSKTSPPSRAAQLISEDLGIKLGVRSTMLGRAKRVSIDKDSTTIMERHGKKKDIEARIGQIKTQIEDTTSDYDKEKLQERLAGKLSGGVAVIKVGGSTEVEVKDAKTGLKMPYTPQGRPSKKASCRAAAWRSCALQRPSTSSSLRTRTRRLASTSSARRSHRQARLIATNAGEDGAVVSGQILENAAYGFGYNAQSGEYGDLTGAKASSTR